MEDDDIEILDIFDNDKKENKVEEIKKEEPNKEIKEEKPIKKENKKKKDDDMRSRKRVKKKAVQGLFCLLSAIFLLSCLGIYGYRFIKYYRIYNPKVDSSDGSVLLAKDIVGKSEFVTDDEAGLISSSGNYIYKGDVDNNYLKYNDMLWRIVRINSDNSIDIILDDYITLLPWNGSVVEFTKSDIYEYLNNTFLSKLDKDMLNKTSFCTDKISDLTNITCDDTDIDSYVKLLDVANFLNSVLDSKTYLSREDEIFWLSDYGTDKIWHTNGFNVSQSDANLFYEIRPMVRLKNTTVYKEGDGTLEKPYEVGKKEELKVGSRVVLGEDKWIVMDISDDIKLMKETVLDKQMDFDLEKNVYNDSKLMKYLNEDYIKDLSYKDKLVETTWYTGVYKTKLDDMKSDTVKAKVAIPSLLDINFDSKVSLYFTSTGQDDRILVYENPLRPGKPTTYRSVRPCIAISKDNLNKLKYSDGVFKVGE